ncbi:DUF6030 family protein [Rhizobium panacihumi]|uniref:DUF6030 family protein n=1 Tax=Rhizobium panacihumi TaxID=2008450 RepID=UPI003D79C45B
MGQNHDKTDARQARPPMGSDAERYPERRPARRIVMILFVTIAICGVMVPVLLANNGRNLELVGDRLGLPLYDWWRGKTQRVELPPQPQSAAPPVPAEIAKPQQKTIPIPAISTPPSRLVPPAESWQPEAGCNAVEPGATGEKPVFLTAPDGRSECTVLIALSDADKASSLFLQVRATGNGLSSLRMKLNFGEDGAAGALPQKAADLAVRILAPISDDDRAYLQGKMIERQAFRTEIGDYRMTFRAEGNDTARFNFIAVSKVKEPAVTAEEEGEAQSGRP